jgi:hypothetical protein
MTQPAAFYVADGDGFVATPSTRGPWNPAHQHAGPPAALLGRVLEQALGRDLFITRIAFDLPRPVPVDRLTAAVESNTGGSRVRRVTAVLRSGTQTVMAAAATAIRISDVPLPPLPALDLAAPAPPESLPENPFPFFQGDEGYHMAMEVRFARGGFGHRQSTAWLRPRVALVEGQVMSPLQRVLCAADSGNGVSNVLGVDRYLFINPDLSVHLHRLPAGDWICLDAYTTPEPHGVGVAHSRLHDQRGPIGHAVQSLLVAERT